MYTGIGYKNVIGREELIGRLENIVRTDAVSHAYIFHGEKGSGKELLTRLFAMAIQCEEKTGDACMKCSVCQLTIAGNNPDLVIVSHEKPDSIGVAEIHEQLVDNIEERPYALKKKIYIVPDAQKMTTQAQNALLKTLEEPPEYAVIILLTENPEALLPTIRSRCVIMDLKPVDEERVKTMLVREYLVPEEDAAIYASMTQGNIGKALRLVRNDDFGEIMFDSIRFLRQSKGCDAQMQIDFMKQMTGSKASINEYLDVFLLWFRDVLYYKATRDEDCVILKNERRAIRQRASRSSYEGLQNILEAIQTAKTRISANVNPDVALELLMITIREN